MIELVINEPHLQTHGQRFGTTVLTVSGWLLWSYFFFPLVTLSCWLVDNEVCSQWVNLSGGYLNLQEMLLIYVQTIAALIIGWGLWFFYNTLKRNAKPAFKQGSVSTSDLCDAFKVKEDELKQCQKSRYAVVHFDQSGHIVGLDCG